jgi:hypothetical protein
MSALTIRDDNGDWQVWIALKKGNPTRMNESFIVGMGATRDEAVADAVKDLETCIDELQAEPVTK